MTPFSFRGTISSSKSIFNRALIARSFAPEIRLVGHSRSEDVLHLIDALARFGAGETNFFCGDGGTTLRFLAFRVSRQPGAYVLSGSAALFARPIEDLRETLRQLGVSAAVDNNSLKISGDGWKLPKVVSANSRTSSQFVSGLLLSAWDLPAPLNVEFPDDMPSRSYLNLTINLLRAWGMEIKVEAGRISVSGAQTPSIAALTIEPDMSSLFAIAACAAMNGRIEIENVPERVYSPTRFLRNCSRAWVSNGTTAMEFSR